MRDIEEQRLARWLSRHHGVISRQEAAALGISARTLYTLVRQGRLIRRHAGIYVDSSRLATTDGAWLADSAAALLAAGPTAALAFRSAAWLWGVWPRAPRPIEIVMPGGGRTRLTGVRVHRTVVPFAGRSTQGLRLTDPARTVVDLAGSNPTQVEGVIDQMLSARLLRVRDLEKAAHTVAKRAVSGAAPQRRRGIGVLRNSLATLGYLNGPPPSVLETRMLRVLALRQLPMPSREVVAGPHGEYRLDFAYPEERLAFEVDGHAWHSNPQQVAHDQRRRRQLRAAGWTLLVYTWIEVMEDEEEVVQEITAAYERLTANRPAPA